MRKFKEFISEEILPFAQTEKGFVGIDNGPVRDNINLLLANVTTMPYSTPYHAMEAVRRVLVSFHISLPATNFMSGEAGHEAFPINQFGKKMGVLPTGDVVTQMPSAYYVYFEYEMNDRGSFDIFCEIVDEEELNDILDDVEDEESEIEHDAENSYDAYKAGNMNEDYDFRAKQDAEDSAAIAKRARKPSEKRFWNKAHKENSKKAVTGMDKKNINEISSDLARRYIKKAKESESKARGDLYKHSWLDMKDKRNGEGLPAASAKAAHHDLKVANKRESGISLAKGKLTGDQHKKWEKPKGKRNITQITKDTKVLTVKEESLDEVSKQLASKAAEKAYDAGHKYYDSTSVLRRKAIRSKDKGDLDAAHAEQGKMSKKWKQSMKFKAYADKKMEEETINELSKGTLGSYVTKASHDVATKSAAVGRYAERSRTDRSNGNVMSARSNDNVADKMFKKSWKRRQGIAKATDKLTREENINEISAGKANDAYHAAADKGKMSDLMAGATGKKKWKDRANKQWGQARKFADYADKKSMKEEKAPFDNPTEKPSTPYKNPKAKAKQLARAAMKKAMRSDKAFSKLNQKDQDKVNAALRREK